jgi:protein involved in polysaccharide export with SLBB domain
LIRALFLIAALAVSTASLGCARGAASLPPATAPVDDTTLGTGDVFEVRVYGEPELTGRYRVAQDGTIDYPLVGRVVVAEREPTEVADALREALQAGEYLRDPQLSVMVVEYNSKKITVMGAVASSGQYPLTAGLTLVQAISLAGGFNALANPGETTVTRRVDGELQRFRVDADAASRGRAADFVLRAGDIVFVPERAF